MQRIKIELWVGIFMVAGMAGLVMLAFKIGNLGGGDVGETYQVTAAFGNIGGLNTKAPVTVAGVRIGRVSDIRLDHDEFRAVVELSIDRDFNNLPLDTSASILTQGLLGAQYVSLEPGGDETFLRQGDRIDITQSALVFERLIGQFLFNQAQGGN